MGATATKRRAGDRTWGLLAQYSTPADLTRAAQRVRDAGYTKWDVYSPFPVHGMNEAMGIPRSRIGWIVVTGAAMGVITAVLLQWWTSAVDYRINVNGKPLWAWEQFTPIIFELGVLFSAFCAVFGMLALNGLPRPFHPLFNSERFLRVGDDAFFIAIEASDPKFSKTGSRSLLEHSGATSVEAVEE